MEINQTILKNEKLATKMQEFKTEIERMENIKALLKQRCQSECDPVDIKLIQSFGRNIKSVKERFKMVNDEYVDENSTASFLNEVREGMEEINDFLARITLKPKPNDWR